MKKISLAILLLIILLASGYATWQYIHVHTKETPSSSVTISNPNPEYEVGDIIDAFNNVYIYYNGDVNNTLENYIAADGYDFGPKYQCVEFIKRYYYQCFDHRMPVGSGYAKEFFDKETRDAYLNKNRNLYQFKNPSLTKPKVHDIIVFDATPNSPYGHVAIISRIRKDRIEFVQQNPCAYGKSRGVLPLYYKNKLWHIDSYELLGWLRKPKYDNL